jgi:hypothetical protein
MIYLRLLSVLAAGLVLIIAPMALDPGGHGMPGWKALFTLFCMVLMAASFVFVAVRARRIRHYAGERRLAAALLAIPGVGALAMLATGKDAGLLCASGLLLAFTVLLLLNLLIPDALGHTARRRRSRDHVEPSLS